MKICTICKKEKSLEDYSWRNKLKNLRSRECKDCHKIIRNKYYENNKTEEKQRTKSFKISKRKWYTELKEKLSCPCGEKHIAVLQFHHLNPEEKDFEISLAIGKNWSKQRIIDEMKKCIILCANCHLKLHWELRNQNIIK